VPTSTGSALHDPVLVLAVSNEQSLRDLLPQYWERRGPHPAGAYVKGSHRQYIAFRLDTKNSELSQLLLHEYVHLLSHENVKNLPIWLDEGLSEFWSTLIIQGDTIEMGRAPLEHVKNLRDGRDWISLDELLAVKRIESISNAKRLSMFYAESWALTHYLMLGGQDANLGFAPAIPAGDTKHLEAEFMAYVRAGTFPVVLRPLNPRPVESASVQTRSMSEGESLVARASFLADGERPAAALPLLEKALAISPNDAPALEALGYLQFQQNKPAPAAASFNKAIASGKASYLAYFYRAVLAGPVPIGPSPDGKAGEEEYLRTSVELNPYFSEGYARLSDLARQAGRPQEAVADMRKASELDPGDAGYRARLDALVSFLP
jgi:tetratricopeptide (TPR) repeat protein